LARKGVIGRPLCRPRLHRSRPPITTPRSGFVQPAQRSGGGGGNSGGLPTGFSGNLYRPWRNPVHTPSSGMNSVFLRNGRYAAHVALWLGHARGRRSRSGRKGGRPFIVCIQWRDSRCKRPGGGMCWSGSDSLIVCAQESELAIA
jgi:hypothetical protein